MPEANLVVGTVLGLICITFLLQRLYRFVTQLQSTIQHLTLTVEQTHEYVINFADDAIILKRGQLHLSNNASHLADSQELIRRVLLPHAHIFESDVDFSTLHDSKEQVVIVN